MAAEIKRETWATRLGFIMAAVGSAIGLGNVWRFNWLMYRYGGGAFLIPYFIILVLVGFPLMIGEFLLGHYFRGSAPKAFRGVHKSLEWLGWWAVFNAYLITIYYCVVLAWVLVYIPSSAILAWGIPASMQEVPKATLNYLSTVLFSPSFKGYLIIALAITWILIYLTIVSGVRKGIERACKIAVSGFWILAAILIVRAVTLPGATEGLTWALKPKWDIIIHGVEYPGDVWVAAVGQIFFTLSLAFGIMIAYASYLPKYGEINNNALITSFGNCAFSYFCMWAIWGITGFLMWSFHVTNPAQLKIPLGGAGLAFATIPAGITLMPGPVAVKGFFGVVFFLMLFLAGFSSAISLIEAMFSALMDKFGISRRIGVPILCVVGFLGGIPFILNPGLIDPIDSFCCNIGLVIIGLLEAIVITWIWAWVRNKKLLFNDEGREYANLHGEFKIGKWWDILLGILTPVLLLIMFARGIGTTIGIMSQSVTGSIVAIIYVIIATAVATALKWRKGGG